MACREKALHVSLLIKFSVHYYYLVYIYMNEL